MDVKKQSTGYRTQQEIDWLEELFLSEYVVEQINGQFIPVIINTDSIEKYKSQDNLFAFTFEYVLAAENRVIDAGLIATEGEEIGDDDGPIGDEAGPIGDAETL